jgi:hypothetical protein
MEEFTQSGVPNTRASDAHQSHGRPRAVTFVAGLSMVEGFVAAGLAALYVAGWRLNGEGMQAATVTLLLDRAALLGISGVSLLVAGVGLLRLSAWAWTLAMATQGLTLTVALYQYLSGNPDYLLMPLGVLAVLLLNRQEVRLTFEPAERRRD